MWTFQLVSQTQQLDMVSLVFQAAVPKYITMDKIKNNMLGTKSLMIKLKLKYESKGETVEEMATITIGQGEY